MSVSDSDGGYHQQLAVLEPNAGADIGAPFQWLEASCAKSDFNPQLLVDNHQDPSHRCFVLTG